MKIKAFAKVNLSLRVFERRPDGYHTIESIMQSISLCDYVTIEPIASGIEITCNHPAVPSGKENLVYKAVEVFLDQRPLNPGWRIQIEKRIPLAAGLAGGSADAAAVLFGLRQITKDQLPITNEELIQLASQIGSDVPFCLIGGTGLVKGRGEIVEPLEPWPHTYFVLVNPGMQVSAKWAYAEFDRLQLTVSEPSKNDLEAVVVQQHPVIADIKQELIQLGCSTAQMSGSGPTVFGIIKRREEAERILAAMREKFANSYMTETVERGVDTLIH